MGSTAVCLHLLGKTANSCKKRGKAKEGEHCGAIYGAIMLHIGMTSSVCSGPEYTWQDSQHCIVGGRGKRRKVGSHNNTVVPSIGVSIAYRQA